VINDSIPWREQLLRSADDLERRKTQRRWTERTSFLVERDVMVGCYAVRRLHEARKVSDTLASRAWRASSHRLIGRPPDRWGRFAPWEHYDMESSQAVALGLTEFCNQFIHSWVWMISVTMDDVFDGIFISSDWQRRKSLFHINVDELVGLFRAVGSEDIVSVRMRRDRHGEMQYTEVVAATPDTSAV
jgi:hypothetical protein